MSAVHFTPNFRSFSSLLVLLIANVINFYQLTVKTCQIFQRLYIAEHDALLHKWMSWIHVCVNFKWNKIPLYRVCVYVFVCMCSHMVIKDYDNKPSLLITSMHHENHLSFFMLMLEKLLMFAYDNAICLYLKYMSSFFFNVFKNVKRRKVNILFEIF